MVWLIEGGNTKNKHRQKQTNTVCLIEKDRHQTGSYFARLRSFRSGEYIDQNTEFYVDALRGTCEFTTVVKVACCRGKGRYLSCERCLQFCQKRFQRIMT